MTGITKLKGEKRFRAEVEKRSTIKTTSEAERTEQINAEYDKITAARTEYFTLLKAARQHGTAAFGEEYSVSMQEWGRLIQDAARERDAFKRAQLEAMAKERWENAQKLRTELHRHSATHEEVYGQLQRTVAECEARIIELGGKLNLTAGEAQPGKEGASND